MSQTSSYAFISGYNHAKNGGHIDNCYPFTKGNGYWEWLDGYRSYTKPKNK